MDGPRFDDFARSLAGRADRRAVLAGLLGLGAGALGLRATEAQACPPGQYLGSGQRCLCRLTGRPPAGGVCPCPRGQRDTGDGRGCLACRSDGECPAGDACAVSACVGGACARTATPVDCVVSEWGDWSACSAACGGGKQTRTRSIVTPASCGGRGCPATEETRPCNEQACGACDATQAAAFCSTVTAVDGTQHCGRPGFGPLCCDTDADCATNGLTCNNVVPTFCAKTSQLGTGEPSAVTCAADPSRAGVCCCLAVCDLPT